MKNFIFLGIFSVILFLSWSVSFAEIYAIQSSDSEITVGFSTGKPLIEEVSFEHGKTLFHQIGLPDCPRLFTVAGNPDLPQAEFMIGIPQTGDIILSVKPVNFLTFRNINVAPVPKQSWDSTVFKKSDVYQENRYLPGPLAEIKEIGVMRNIRVARILISPAQYNPVTKELKVFDKLAITLGFTEKPTVQPSPDFFDPIYEATLLNGKTAKDWKRISKTEPQIRNFFESSNNWLKVKTETTGVYKITYQDLNQLGILPNTISPRTLRLFNIGNYITNDQYPDSMIEIPIYVYGEADGSFDPNDYILFYAKSVSDWDSTQTNFKTNLFTKYNYYWLTYGNEIGRRMALLYSSSGANPIRIQSAKRRIHFEKDLLCPARSGLLWLWDHLTKGTDKLDTSLVITFNLPNPDTILTLTGAVSQPASNLTARFNTYLNENLIGTREIRSVGYPPYIFALETLPPVTSESNSLRIQLFGETEMQLYFDYFEVEYQQKLDLSQHVLNFSLAEPGEYELVVKGVHQTPFIFDISNPYAPGWITDFVLNGDSLKFQLNNSKKRFYHITDWAKLHKPISIEKRSPGKLKAEINPAHYYLIAPDELYDAAKLLERHRNN
ncbi:MAG: C25 family peptidase propeptide domain-containing protein, partial [bacterium]